MQTTKSPLSVILVKIILIPLFFVMVISGCDYIVPNKPPYVKKLAPADSSVYTVGDVIKFQANAYDNDGTLVHVVFTPQGGTAFIDDTAPYEYDWSTTGFPQGDYLVQIMAVDNKDEPYIISVPVRLLGNDAPNAGKDTIYTSSRLFHSMDADTPKLGEGTWSIVSGIGGSFSEIHNPKAIFTGVNCQMYTLRWSVSNGVNVLFDDVVIYFNYQPSKAFAGLNQIVTAGGLSTLLQAVTPMDGTGSWSILTGGIGTFSNPALPNSAFTGLPCSTYSLVWTVATPCAVSADTVEIRFDQSLENPNAGPDQSFADGRTSIVLAANTPTLGSGIWTIISGTNGRFSSASNPNATFFGQVCETYVLRWTFVTPCSTKSDDVVITLNHIPSMAYAGVDQTLSSGLVTTQLAATSPAIGAGQWTVISGVNGYFSDPTDAHTIFTGQLCQAYVLRWTVSTSCSSSYDDVNIQLSMTIANADAGSDIRVSGGNLFAILQGNAPGTGVTGTWSIISGLGGSFNDVNSNNTRFNGVSGQIYLLKWTFTSSCSESSDLVAVSFIFNETFVDVRDSKIYQSVVLGNQTWMAENLNYTSTGSYTYDGNATNASTYGRLYDWNNAQTACPVGWELPTDNDWRLLEGFLGMDATTSVQEFYRGTTEGGMLKETGTQYWNSPNAGATNITGFSARPGGNRSPDGTYGGIKTIAEFWTSTDNASGKGLYRGLTHDKSQIGRSWNDKTYGFSVRCIKK